MSEPFPNREWESAACHVDGLKLAYRRRAGAAYPLIALHGLMGSGACLLPLARYLPADLDIILPDARGHGGSDAPSSGYGYGDMASDVVGIVEKLSLHSPVLLGHSMGGLTAALATSERGLAITALVLVDPTFLDPERQREVHDRDVAGEHRRSITAPRQTLLDQARSRNPRRSEELIEHLVDARLATSLEVFAVLEPPNPDFRDIVTALKVPTLLVIGDRGILSVDTAKELHERNPLSKLRNARGCRSRHGTRRATASRISRDSMARRRIHRTRTQNYPTDAAPVQRPRRSSINDLQSVLRRSRTAFSPRNDGGQMNRRTFILSTAAVVATSASATARGGRAMSDAARFTAARRFVALPAGRIAYVERGRGPAALFLHGFPVNGFQWRGALESLAAHRRCIAPDFMGLGYSEPKPGQDLRAPAQLEMLLSLLDKLGVAAVDLVANDSGCAVAQLFLAHHPERVRTLLLTNGDTEPDCPPAALEGVVKAATAGTFASGFRPCLTDKDACRRPGQLGGDTFTFPARLRDDTIDTYLAPLLAHPERTNAFGRTFDENTLAGTSKLLSAVRAPVRILWGTGDTIFKQSSADYLDKLFPNSRGVRRIAGAKLFFPEEFPALIGAECRALWRV